MKRHTTTQVALSSLRRLGLALLGLLVAAISSAQDFSDRKSSNEKNLPVAGTLVNMLSPQNAGKILRAGNCSGAAAAPVWGDLCPESFAAMLSAATVLTATQPISDSVAVYDASANATKQVAIADLTSGAGGTVCSEEFYSNGSSVGVPVFGCNMPPNWTTTGALTLQGGAGANHPGVARVTPFTGATDKAGVYRTTMTGTVEFGSGPRYYMATFKLTQKSNNTETFTVFSGFNDSNAALGTDGAVFSYTCNQAGGTCTPPAGDWIGTTVSNSVSTGSACDTGIAADTNWHTYEILVTSAGDHAYFYIDHVLKCDNTANIPTGTARATDILPFLLIKSASAGGQPTADLDFYKYASDFTTAR